MIIKSLSRRYANFRQLLGYLHKPQSKTPVLTHNLFASSDSPWQQAAEEFEHNATYLRQRKNGVAVYHEIIALNQCDVTKKEQARILVLLAKEYLKQRAPAQLAYGRIHTNTDHIHMHLAISSNKVRSTKRERLTKQQFAAIQAKVEAIQLERYPEVGLDRVYGADKNDRRLKIRNAEYEAAKRQQVTPRKQQVRADLEEVVRRCTSHVQLKQQFFALGYSLYQRGAAWGVEEIESGRKHRLKTLGLQDEFQSALDRFSTLSRRQEELKGLHVQRAPAHTNERGQNGGLEQ